MLREHISNLFAILVSLSTLISLTGLVEDCVALYPMIKAGAYKRAGMTKDHFLARLTWLKFSQRLNPFRRAYASLTKMYADLKFDKSDGTIRKQPFALILEGPPGSGKTTNALKIAQECIKAKYGICKASDIVVLNETDEFQSEYRTNHKVVIFDDVNAETYTASTKNPFTKFIDFINNIRKTSLNPNVELKGTVYIEPDLIIITSNMKSFDDYILDERFYISCRNALIRRISFILETHRDNWVLKHYIPNKTGTIWNTTNFYAGQPQKLAAVEDIQTRDEIISHISSTFVKHLSEQEKFIDTVNSTFDSENDKECSVVKSIMNDLRYTWRPSRDYLEAIGVHGVAQAFLTTSLLNINESVETDSYCRWRFKDGLRVDLYVDLKMRMPTYMKFIKNSEISDELKTEEIIVYRSTFTQNKLRHEGFVYLLQYKQHHSLYVSHLLREGNCALIIVSEKGIHTWIKGEKAWRLNLFFHLRSCMKKVIDDFILENFKTVSIDDIDKIALILKSSNISLKTHLHELSTSESVMSPQDGDEISIISQPYDPNSAGVIKSFTTQKRDRNFQEQILFTMYNQPKTFRDIIGVKNIRVGVTTQTLDFLIEHYTNELELQAFFYIFYTNDELIILYRYTDIASYLVINYALETLQNVIDNNEVAGGATG